MDTDSFIIHIITKDFYKDIDNDVGRWFDTSNYDENDKRLLPAGMNKNAIVLFKDEEERLWKNFVQLEQKHMHT